MVPSEFLQFSSELDLFLLRILYRLCKPKPLQVSGYTLQINIKILEYVKLGIWSHRYGDGYEKRNARRRKKCQ